MTSIQALVLRLMLGVVSVTGPCELILFLMNALHDTDFWNREAHLVFGTLLFYTPE